MARFHFRLERILAVRRHEEDHERLKFGQAMRLKLDCEMKLAEARERIRAAMEQAALVTAGYPTIDDLVRSHEYRLALFRREAEAQRSVEDAAVALELQRLRLVEARRRRRALELLREKKWRDWRHEEEERDQQELDEIGLMNFIKRANEEAEAMEIGGGSGNAGGTQGAYLGLDAGVSGSEGFRGA